MRLLSWNVNGLRSMEEKGLTQWLPKEHPDLLCLQETKAQPEQLSDALLHIDGYHSYFSAAERKGYSGVGLYTQEAPLEVQTDFEDPYLNAEGRLLQARYRDFLLLNVYFPNGKASQERLDYKMAFNAAFLTYAKGLLATGEHLVVCGDVNTAHQEIDLARPKENEQTSGFLPMEREWIDQFLAIGFVDSLREFHSEGELYSWWDLRTRARRRNVGWRIDYFFISEGLRSKLQDAFILPEVYGSDHCPVGIELAL